MSELPEMVAHFMSIMPTGNADCWTVGSVKRLRRGITVGERHNLIHFGSMDQFLVQKAKYATTFTHGRSLFRYVLEQEVGLT
jgi:hypothetical protein